MKFRDLVNGIDNAGQVIDTSADITDICYDSRKVRPGCLFVAINGSNTDGARYIPDAIKGGAAAVLCEKAPESLDLPAGIGYIRSSNALISMAQASARFFDYPSRNMKLIGITGTSGKTTVSHIVYSILNNAGIKTGLIGTIKVAIGDQAAMSSHTTPLSRELQEIFAHMRGCGAGACVMECSSHALDQGRVEKCDFDICAFLNIARDHLDYHKTADAYREAKLKLFTEYAGPDSVSVVNLDDTFSREIISKCRGQVVTFSQTGEADVTGKDASVYADHVEFTLCVGGVCVPVYFHMGGEFNISNVLAAAAICYADGISLPDIKKGIELCQPVSGRFQAVKCDRGFSVIVDYAHTPDELEKLLISARKLTKGRLLILFGCGGNRDRGKRPIMGRIAITNSDRAVISSDNPRYEEPMEIIREIISGIPGEYASRWTVEPDRRKAIKEIIREARKDDLVVIAGKGHEGYQEIK
ncbi:MAG: UDP-N-acetylmuramoyl-L-alanyl-D-glutamate--2,6-diaminopimelate ligase, partial [Abditibacteriota bacterium]|nr:UDP-N-acetylmuramoyl-L-alanyl-D-glutamate--2,6-diaminopimelate ligase [Abditibacteriota bacterium]